jgi:hypothetical protein
MVFSAVSFSFIRRKWRAIKRKYIFCNCLEVKPNSNFTTENTVFFTKKFAENLHQQILDITLASESKKP